MQLTGRDEGNFCIKKSCNKQESANVASRNVEDIMKITAIVDVFIYIGKT